MDHRLTVTEVDFSLCKENGIGDITDDGSSETIAELDVPAMIQPSFDVSCITMLDINSLQEVKQEVFRTGCLPKWIICFSQLQVLNAAKLGLIILEPWLLELKHLRELHLEQNHISTWPYFLCQAKKIKFVNLNGNPCLEKAFNKSPTLRSEYFKWSAFKDTASSIPSCIRGPEWLPAASARLNKNGIIKDLGFFCGGIYTLSTPPKNEDNGLLTTLTPCVLETRLAQLRPKSEYSHKSTSSTGHPSSPRRFPSMSSFSSSFLRRNSESSSHKEETRSHIAKKSVSSNNVEEEEKKARIVFEIFDDIDTLVNRFEIGKKSASSRQARVKPALIVGTHDDSFNKLLPNCDRLSIEAIRQYSYILIEEEQHYIEKLHLVNKHFCNSKIKSSTVSGLFRTVFVGFPAMLSIHVRDIEPCLRNLAKKLDLVVQIVAGPQSRLREARIEVVKLIRTAAIDLCTAFRQLDMALPMYAGNIVQAEYILDTKSSICKLYEDKDFGDLVQMQASRMVTGFAGHLSSKSASAPSLGFRLSSTSYTIESLEPFTALTSWLDKVKHRDTWQAKHPPAGFIYLPLVALVRFDRIFTSLYKTEHSFWPVVNTLRRIRTVVSRELEQSRQRERVRVLVGKFRTQTEYFTGYEWDALLSVRSRAYFERGILAENTNDVIDTDDMSTSFVKEMFGKNRRRLLRLICCNGEVQIWDEILEQEVGRVDKARVHAIDPIVERQKSLAVRSRHIYKAQEVRLVFIDVRETCLVEVKGFAAKYPNSPNHRREFLDACLLPCKKTF